MTAVRAVIGALAVASCLGLAAPAEAGPYDACAQRVIRDWYSGGRVDGKYPLACYRAAMRALPEDVRQYSDADREIARALAYARQGLRDPGPGPAAPARKPKPAPPPPQRERAERATSSAARASRSAPAPAPTASGRAEQAGSLSRRASRTRPRRAGPSRKRCRAGRRHGPAVPGDRPRHACRAARGDRRWCPARSAAPPSGRPRGPLESRCDGAADFPANCGFYVSSDRRPRMPGPLAGRAPTRPARRVIRHLGTGRDSMATAKQATQAPQAPQRKRASSSTACSTTRRASRRRGTSRSPAATRSTRSNGRPAMR